MFLDSGQLIQGLPRKAVLLPLRTNIFDEGSMREKSKVKEYYVSFYVSFIFFCYFNDVNLY